jgi:isoquinoline 1-oxidoreductase beta subunit
MAFVASYGSLCAQVAEVSLIDGRPFVHRVVCALDCGSIVTPDGARSQIEGGIVQGLSAAFGEAIRIEGGQALNRNFDSYTVLRMQDAPAKIESIIIESGETMGGVGEPPLPPIAPAVANALRTLTGKPVRKLPIGA